MNSNGVHYYKLNKEYEVLCERRKKLLDFDTFVWGTFMAEVKRLEAFTAAVFEKMVEYNRETEQGLRFNLPLVRKIFDSFNEYHTTFDKIPSNQSLVEVETMQYFNPRQTNPKYSKLCRLFHGFISNKDEIFRLSKRNRTLSRECLQMVETRMTLIAEKKKSLVAEEEKEIIVDMEKYKTVHQQWSILDQLIARKFKRGYELLLHEIIDEDKPVYDPSFVNRYKEEYLVKYSDIQIELQEVIEANQKKTAQCAKCHKEDEDNEDNSDTDTTQEVEHSSDDFELDPQMKEQLEFEMSIRFFQRALEEQERMEGEAASSEDATEKSETSSANDEGNEGLGIVRRKHENSRTKYLKKRHPGRMDQNNAFQ